MSKAKYDVKGLKKSILSAVDKDAQSEILDILVAFDDANVSAEVIKELKLGNSIKQVKDKYQGTNQEIADKAKAILLAWKNKVSSSANVSSENSINVVATATLSAAAVSSSGNVPTNSSSSSSSSSIAVSRHSAPSQTQSAAASVKTGAYDNFWIGTKVYENIPELRRNIVKGIVQIFAKWPNTASVASVVGFSIELEVNQTIPFDLQPKEHAAKCRTLAFNLMKNERLREAVAKKDIPLSRLITMTNAELATPEIAHLRDQAYDLVSDAKRGDWLESHREEIQRSNDIDPNNTWAFDEDNGSDPEGVEEAD